MYKDKKFLKMGRDTNLELYRIITMFLIVAHHYVVNSGLTAIDGPIYVAPTSLKSLFLLIFGAWGKTGINCFDYGIFHVYLSYYSEEVSETFR